MKEKRKLTKSIALCGVLAALSVGMMCLGGLTVLDLSILLVCSLITVLTVIETGNKMAWIYAAVTSTLALLLLPNKLYAMEYVLFGALYPVLKGYIEKLPRTIAFVLKIAMLDVMLLSCLIVGQVVLGLGEEYFSLSFITVGLGTLFFAFYDYTLTKCISYYIVILRKKLRLK
ncbi:MAG: hypothetical protein E7628_06470 [Ruminococcaceae bacterium]|nr:hypothetical protein [Oscillospiraceae bacterium]